MVIRDIAILFGYQVDKKTESSAENSIKGLKDMATKLLGAIGIGFSLVQLNAISEEFTGINNQIRNATKELGNQREIQQKILEAANDTKSSYANTAKMVSSLVQESPDLFGSVDEANEFNSAMVKLFKTAGKGNEEIAGLQEAINKSFAKGKVDSETMSQLLERSPEAIILLNQRLGSTKDQLEQMASEGRISLNDLKMAFIENADVINENFGMLNYTISDALLNIKNQWGLWVSEMDQSLGVSQTIGRFMVRSFTQIMEVLKKVTNFVERLSNRVGGFENLLKLVASTAAAIFIAMNAQKILTFLNGVVKLLTGIKLGTIANLLIWLGLFLIVEDFIAFLQGKDSVIGKILESIGVDTDKVRESFQWLSDAVGNAIKWVINNLDKLIPILYGLAVVMALIKIVTVAWTAVQWLLNAAMAANPVMLVIIVIMALIAAIVLLWNNSEEFRNFWIGLWEGIKEVAGAVANWFVEAWNNVIIALTTAWNSVRDFFVSLWEGISTAFSSAIDAIGGLFTGLYNTVMGILEPIFGFIDKVKNGVASAVEKVKGWFGGGDMNATVSASTKSAVAGGGNKTSNVKQDVNITNNFNGGDANAQKAGAKAMGKSANDATSYMARGLAYGR